MSASHHPGGDGRRKRSPRMSFPGFSCRRTISTNMSPSIIKPSQNIPRNVSTPRSRFPRYEDTSPPELALCIENHPLTPHAQVVLDIPPLIERCFKFMDYTMCIQVSIADTLQTDEEELNEAQKKADTLHSILRVVNDPISRHAISENAYRLLFHAMCKHIFHEHVNVKKEAEYSEFTTVYYIRNWNHLVIAHKILRALMHDHGRFMEFLTKDFAKKLIDSLDTPIRSEQQQFEETAKMIIEGYIGQRHNMLSYMISLLINYADGVTDTTAIGSILRLFTAYFMSFEPPLKTINYMIFRTVIFPLLSTHGAADFENPLCDLSLIFQASDAATALWCLKYLDSHWPKASVKKELTFLRHLTSLIPVLPSTLLSSTASIIIKLLSKSVRSASVSISIFAIMYCNNEDFLNVYKPTPELILKFLIPATREATKMWKNEIQEYAHELLNKLSSFEHSIKPQPPSPRNKSSQSWNQIIEKAVESFPEIDKNKCISAVASEYACENTGFRRFQH